jgi:hypothetical protein
MSLPPGCSIDIPDAVDPGGHWDALHRSEGGEGSESVECSERFRNAEARIRGSIEGSGGSFSDRGVKPFILDLRLTGDTAPRNQKRVFGFDSRREDEKMSNQTIELKDLTPRMNPKGGATTDLGGQGIIVVNGLSRSFKNQPSKGIIVVNGR